MKPTITTNKRYRYSLRLLLTVVTAVSVILAYHANWHRNREEALKQTGIHLHNSLGPIPDAPFLLRVFGSEGQQQIWVDSAVPGEIERMKSLFPEARVFDANAPAEEAEELG